MDKKNKEFIPPEYARMKGYYYSVTDEQIREHQQRSVEQIFEWLETTNEFLALAQSPEARECMMKFRRGEW